MTAIYLMLIVLHSVLFTVTTQAQETQPVTRSDTSTVASAESEAQRDAHREELITRIILNVAKGLAIVIALLVLRSIVGAIGRGVSAEEAKRGTGIVGVFITAGSEDEAATIGRTLVEERLAACANISSPMRSIYLWKDKIEDESEALIIIKTTHERLPDLIRRAEELHSNNVPEIIALPILRGYQPYLDWVAEVTQSTRRKKRSWWRKA